jgi:hypothetical protein
MMNFPATSHLLFSVLGVEARFFQAFRTKCSEQSVQNQVFRTKLEFERLGTRCIVANFRFLSVSALFIFIFAFASCLARGQENRNSVFLANQEVHVTNLPSLTAPSTHRSAVLATALEIILHDKAVCCGKDSALEDAVLYATISDPVSLKELSPKLQGRHPLSDGGAIVVTAEYVPQSSITPGLIVATLRDQHALLIEWKSHLYVLYGSTFDETRDLGSGERDYAIRKLFLLDPRFSDQRRQTEFNRETDDLAGVQGLLTIKAVVSGQ